VPSHDNPSRKKNGICWPGILRTLLVQIVVLLALSGAVVRYLTWSSDAAWAEFIAASEPAAPAWKSHPLSATPADAVKSPVLHIWRV
jgi:hypothetical protein